MHPALSTPIAPFALMLLRWQVLVRSVACCTEDGHPEIIYLVILFQLVTANRAPAKYATTIDTT